jgi:NADP-dependent 3-hydroxy acid dehydrogenase YdfG
MPAGAFADEDDAITDAILDINVSGVVIGTKLALRGMLDRWTGHIVNVARISGRYPLPDWPLTALASTR